MDNKTCKIHNEPENIITDSRGRECIKCYLESKDIKVCEKCGGETGVTMVEDESYDYCQACKWVTH